jgi:FkbM family methyltransferase
VNWKQQAEALSPLLRFADETSSNGESGVLQKIFDSIPPGPGFGVEFGQRSFEGGTLGALVKQRGWSALFMDAQAPEGVARRQQEGGGEITLARERVTCSNLPGLLARYGVPSEFDCLVIDIDGLDYWAWNSLDTAWRPRVVVIEFNAHIDFRLVATLGPDDGWSYCQTRDYGASWAALVALGARKGYRPIHVHGIWNIHFLRSDIPWPEELSLKQLLSVEEFALLTSTSGSFSQLSRPGTRPSWFDAPPPEPSRSPWVLMPDEAPAKPVEVHDLVFEVFAEGHDANWYQQRKIFEERTSLLYPLLAAEGFTECVDIGANIGFVSLLVSQAVPNIRVLAVEADPRLAAIARRNFARAGLHNAVLVNAIAGDADIPATSFSLNPGSTLDNRVSFPRWPTVNIPARRAAHIIERSGLGTGGPMFIKIDTQGYELQVLRGLEPLLQRHRQWLLKMEFAPDWLRSQGTDPLAILDHLQLRYEIVEFPERIVFGTPSTAALFAQPLRVADHNAFLAHVVSLNRNGTGWVDLLVRPKTQASVPSA